MNKKIRDKAKDIKLIAMDIDGVLTPGDIVIMESGEEVKTWNAKDRIGFRLAQRAGNIKFAWISGRKCRQVEERAKELGIDAVYLKILNKLNVLEDILKRFNLDANNLAYIGDDLVDIPVLKRIGLSVCPQDACGDVKAMVDYVTKAEGGKGVFREVVEIVLKAQGSWEEVVKEYMV